MRVELRHLFAVVAFAGAASLGLPPAVAQETPAPVADPAPEPAPAPVPVDEPAEGDEEDSADGPRSTYDPGDRRDPFRALTGSSEGDQSERLKYDHLLKGRLLSEVKLTSIAKTPRGAIATLEGGPRKQGYFAYVGSELWDGTIQAISFENKTVIVRQKVDDPRLIKPYRDVVIQLYSDEEMAKETGSALGGISGGDGGGGGMDSRPPR